MVEICQIVINNPGNKEDLLEKMKEIEDIEEHKILINEKQREEITPNENESKRKVRYTDENDQRYFEVNDPLCKIRIANNCNWYVQWSKQNYQKQINKRAKTEVAQQDKDDE